MKVLFLYRYGILGGVCTQLFHRFRHIPADSGIEIHCGFRSDHGVQEMLSRHATLHFGLNKNTTISFLRENTFDKIIIIDSEEYIEAVREVELKGTVLVEVHTSIERNLEYLSRIETSDIDGFVTVSKYMIDRIEHHIKPELASMEIKRFQNVLDTEIFVPGEVTSDGLPVVAWVGKIDEHKDWKAFMRIASSIHEQNAGVEFWIIGGQTCPESRVLEVFDFAEEMNILSRFRWIDRVENLMMPKLYSLVANRGGLSLVTSHCESFGMSVLESLLSGCPIVTSNVGALPEITDSGNYFQLYDLHDYDSAANMCLETITNSSNVRDSLTAIRDSLVKEYSSKIRSKEYWNLLKSIGEQHE
jgi:glycosyltransferase involved in cell wall biosynthesis